MDARIFQPAKTAMQSGQARGDRWVLEFGQTAAKRADPLMGWTSSPDTAQQVRLGFDTKEAAIAHAKRCGHAYSVADPAPRRPRLKTYAENFAYRRKEPWSH